MAVRNAMTLPVCAGDANVTLPEDVLPGERPIAELVPRATTLPVASVATSCSVTLVVDESGRYTARSTRFARPAPSGTCAT